ncbi:putative toxin-antitoxin system toxin component, PIN family [Aquabacterium commune]|uniref:putative toxin-antitoxin system toxin component, PIN family n=1 Tax=Aquabacterium commune TaxID=70586 RepID=UPI0014153066
MRIVIDTNLLVSGVISDGPPRQLLNSAKAGEFEFCTSETLLTELLDVLSRGKFAARLAQAGLTSSPRATSAICCHLAAIRACPSSRLSRLCSGSKGTEPGLKAPRSRTRTPRTAPGAPRPA